tara:strand:+ start:3491 stop:4603 length:1113 start_codon:yes stop_codon:yes gene_type:complete
MSKLKKDLLETPTTLKKIRENFELDFNKPKELDFDKPKLKRQGARTNLFKSLSKFSLNPCNLIFKILSVLEFWTTFVFGKIAKLEAGLLKGGIVLYIWKALLLIALILIFLVDFLAEWLPFLDGLFNKNALQALYSISKGINVVIILLGTLMGASKITDHINNQPNAPKFPFPLLLVGYLVGALPVLYELLSLVALSSITLAYYTQKCGGKIPNAWGWIDTIGSMVMGIGIIGFILSFLQFRIKKMCGTKTANSKELQGPSILMLTSITFFIVFIVASGLEETVAKNASYWLGMLGDSENPGEECVPDEGKGPDDGFTKILNLIMSILISIVLVVVIIIGCIPIPPLATFNDKVKDILSKALNGLLKLLI